MEGFVMETARLRLRWMRVDDFPFVRSMLSDPVVMAAWEHPFSEEESRLWMARQLSRYTAYKRRFGLWGVIRKSDGAFIGQCGLTLQEAEGKELLEAGYVFAKEAWHQGYAIEAAQAVRDYAFQRLSAPALHAIIRDTNEASRRVAERLGMTAGRVTVKHYYGMDMTHIIYGMTRSEWEGKYHSIS